jgi:hypothetical protein
MFGYLINKIDKQQRGSFSMVISVSFLKVTLFLIVLAQPIKLNQNGGVIKGAKVKNELAIHSVPFDHSLEK